MYSITSCCLWVNTIILNVGSMYATKIFWTAKTPIQLGHDVTLLCDASGIDDCCRQRTRRWHGGPSGNALLANNISADQNKYRDVQMEKKFALVIADLCKTDINVSYTCSYGFETYTQMLYLDEDTHVNDIKTNDDSHMIVIIISVLVVIGLLMLIVSRGLKNKQVKQMCICEILNVICTHQLDNEPCSNASVPTEMPHLQIETKEKLFKNGNSQSKDLLFQHGKIEQDLMKNDQTSVHETIGNVEDKLLASSHTQPQYQQASEENYGHFKNYITR